MSLTEASTKRPVTTLMVFLCFVVIGVISARLISLEYMPDVSFPFVMVHLPYPGSTPEEVEREITRPAEEVLSTISGIKELSSESTDSEARIFMAFDWGEDTSLKGLQARERLEGVRHLFPTDFERIFVRRFSPTDEEIVALRISSSRDLSGAYDMLDRKLRRRIERIPGVSQVILYGVQPREIRVDLQADRLAAHRVDLVDLLGRLQGANFAVTAGSINDGRQRLLVRPTGQIRSVEEIQNLVIGQAGLRVSDVATVTYAEPKLEEGRHLNRTYAIGLEVKKEGGANTVATARRIFEEMESVSKDHEMQGVNLYVMDDLADGIVSSLTDLLEAGLIGGIFAVIVLFFFLRRVSTTMIVTLAVPVSLAITVGALYFLGFSLNVLSMLGLMLAVGMLVDNAVVVTESIHRIQQLEPGDLNAATLKGVKEVALAVTAGTLTTAIVFLPIIVSQADQVTIFLRHAGVTIIIALIVSLLISLTVVPLLSTRLKPPKKSRESRLIAAMVERYGRTLDWLLHHPFASFLMVFLTLASVIIPAKFVDQDFFPDEDNDRRLRLVYHINGAYTLDRVEQAVDVVEEYLFAHQEEFEIESVYSYYRPSFAMSTIILNEGKKANKASGDIEDLIALDLPKLSIGEPSFGWEGRDQGEQIRITLSGESSQRLAELSRDVADVLERVEGLKDVRSQADAGEEEVRVVVDRERASMAGVSTMDVAQTVAGAMRGRTMRNFRTDQGEVSMRVTMQDLDRASMADLENVTLVNDEGRRISLASLATLDVGRGPRRINREDRKTRVGITANLDGLTTPKARARIQQTMDRITLPAGYEWDFGQRFQHEENSQAIMMMNLLLALIMIYIVMAALFESLLYPAAIWTSIVFAIVGVFWFFMLTGTVLSVMAYIGILILIGVVVNNGIVLLDHINHLREQGMTRSEAIVQGGRDRIRPILMTAATTVLGLIPLCIGTTQIGGDGPPYYPMARAIVGGLAFSTVVTLFILPTVYVWLDNLRIWSARVGAKASVNK